MKLYLLVLLLTLVGCGHTPEREIIPVPTFIAVVCEDFGQIESVNILPVQFVNATDSENNEVLGLRGDMYSNLAIIFRDTLRYINEQKKAISYYEKCIEDHNSKTLEKGDPD